MKKYILGLLIVIGVLGFSSAKAEVPSNAFFLGDGKGYDVNGVQTYFCLADNNCYDISGIFAFIKEAQTQITNLQNQVNNLQEKVNQLQQPSIIPTEIPISGTSTPDSKVQPAKFFFTTWAGTGGGTTGDEQIVEIGILKPGVTATYELEGKIYELGSPTYTVQGQTVTSHGSIFHIPIPWAHNAKSYLGVVHLTDGFHIGEMEYNFSS